MREGGGKIQRLYSIHAEACSVQPSDDCCYTWKQQKPERNCRAIWVEGVQVFMEGPCGGLMGAG